MDDPPYLKRRGEFKTNEMDWSMKPLDDSWYKSNMKPLLDALASAVGKHCCQFSPELSVPIAKLRRIRMLVRRHVVPCDTH